MPDWLVEVDVPNSADAPVLEPEELTLSALVHPMGAEEFMDVHFRRHAVVVRGGGAERTSSLFPEAAAGDVAAIAEHTASDRCMVWVKAPGDDPARESAAASGAGVSLPASRGVGLTSVDVEDGRSAAALHSGGRSLLAPLTSGAA